MILLINKGKIYIYIHTIFNLYQQYRHSMAVPSVTNAQGQVSVIQMQWSPEAGAKGTFDQADSIRVYKPREITLIGVYVR
jgi:hypothetical protein